MLDQVKFVGLHREKEKNGGEGGVIYMSDQVKFVGVHRARERKRERDEWGVIYICRIK